MSKLEECARRICCRDGCMRTASPTTDCPLWRDWIPEARAVLEALRTPSEAMVEAGKARLNPDPLYAAETVAAVISSAIDAALKENP